MRLFAFWLWACAPPDSNPPPVPDPVVDPPDDPVPPALTLAIDAPTLGIRDLRCAATVAEGDVTAWRWTADGAPTADVGSVIPAGKLVIGQSWTCGATAEGPGGVTTATSPPFVVPAPPGGNVLIVLLDDMGTDKIASYHMESPPAYTPTLDAFAAGALQLQTTWATSACSTTRAQLLTGRHGQRTGLVVSLADGQADFALPDGEILLPELLAFNRAGTVWDSLAIGKWHLASDPLFTHGHVASQGFGAFQGVKSNLDGESDYFEWLQVWADGSQSGRTGYLTTAQADDTLALLAGRQEPWLAYVALTAPHSPIHVPPADLQGTGVTAESAPADLFDAALEAADHELGRIFAGIDPDVLARTTVIVLGDNGTPDFAVRPPLDPEHAKLTMYEGGVRVPLWIAGPLVAEPGRTSDALVSVLDVFATIADISGVPLTGEPGAHHFVRPGGAATPIDGYSLLPLMSDPEAAGERQFLWLEGGAPNGSPPWVPGGGSVRDAAWKLLQIPGEPNRLYRLGPLLDEGEELIAAGPLDAEAESALVRLNLELARRRATTTYAW